jgi:hypothetical protein
MLPFSCQGDPSDPDQLIRPLMAEISESFRRPAVSYRMENRTARASAIWQGPRPGADDPCIGVGGRQPVSSGVRSARARFTQSRSAVSVEIAGDAADALALVLNVRISGCFQAHLTLFLHNSSFSQGAKKSASLLAVPTSHGRTSHAVPTCASAGPRRIARSVVVVSLA